MRKFFLLILWRLTSLHTKPGNSHIWKCLQICKDESLMEKYIYWKWVKKNFLIIKYKNNLETLEVTMSAA